MIKRNYTAIPVLPDQVYGRPVKSLAGQYSDSMIASTTLSLSTEITSEGLAGTSIVPLL
jgi:hypothetical protein